MALYGLSDWSFAFDRAVKRWGACWFQRRTISLSIHHVELHDLASVEDTVRHEIAHALAGPDHVHDAVWRAIAISVGANPDWREEVEKPPPGRWQANCPNCGHLYHRYRDPQKSTVPARGKIWCCKRCGPVLGRLAWREVASPRGDAAGVAEEQKGTRG
jgi:predicted SprT family Zn-dependent metalloprotease